MDVGVVLAQGFAFRNAFILLNFRFESHRGLEESTKGIRGILLNRRNIPIMSMPIESMLLAVNSNFLVFFVSSDDMMGQSFASLVPTVAAAESAIGLAIFVTPNPSLPRNSKVDVVQRLEEKALRDYCCWFDVSVVGSRLMLSGKIDIVAEVNEEITLSS
uniref:NADH dehydrogenase subunit 4L, mitochondrial n=1 Tax=Tanacetum cinerariifolium TaxID=118510 RepID=A0A6L2JBA0_TANCI|nr:NADH dehydrogenase subunit 4L, mitochondrial [Tanacetum cinerariifolium]